MRNPPVGEQQRLLMPVARGATHVFDTRVLPIETILRSVRVVPSAPEYPSITVIRSGWSCRTGCDAAEKLRETKNAAEAAFDVS